MWGAPNPYFPMPPFGVPAYAEQPSNDGSAPTAHNPWAMYGMPGVHYPALPIIPQAPTTAAPAIAAPACGPEGEGVRMDVDPPTGSSSARRNSPTPAETRKQRDCTEPQLKRLWTTEQASLRLRGNAPAEDRRIRELEQEVRDMRQDINSLLEEMRRERRETRPQYGRPGRTPSPDRYRAYGRYNRREDRSPYDRPPPTASTSSNRSTGNRRTPAANAEAGPSRPRDRTARRSPGPSQPKRAEHQGPTIDKDGFEITRPGRHA